MTKYTTRKRPAVQRFWEKVAKADPDDCWNWTASIYSSGYGQFWTGTHLTGAHRFAYALQYGPIPNGLQVLHRCDNKLCCNVAHLFLGTQQDNIDDMLTKGRNNQPKGERQRSAKFKESQIIQIRQMYATAHYSHSELARVFGVSKPTIRDIVLRQTWKHVDHHG